MSIVVKDVEFRFVPESPILKGISFTHTEGVLGILGHSGSGKSTLLRVIAGLLRPDAGDVEVDGRPVWRANVTQRRLLQRRIGVVFQHGALFDFLTVGGNLTFALRALRIPRSEWDSCINGALEAVGLDGDPLLLDRWTTEISGGQMRRVGLARVLVTRPDMVIFDEPTTGLDPRRTRDVVEIVKSSLEKSNLSIIVSHDIRFVREVCTSAVLLDQGQITARVGREGIDRLFRPPFESGGDENLQRLYDFIEGNPHEPAVATYNEPASGEPVS